VFFLPYSHIDYVNINRIVKEQEIRELYEKHDAARSEPPVETVAAEESANGVSEGESQPATADEPQPQARPSDPKLTPGRVPMRPVAPAPGTQKLPAAATAGASPGNDTPTPSAARNSILERLRAQRSSPTGRPSVR
jgi:hypothetical protein